MSRPFRLSRRHFLRGAGGVAVALPFLGAMAGTARAVEFPKRFVVFFTGLGSVKSSWVPTGTEKDFTLSPILSPLAAFQKQLLVLEGLDMESAHHGPGDPHQLGIAQALTATELMAGDLFKYACSAQTVGWGGGISLDQFLAQQIGATTKFGSLELGVQVQHSNVSSRISYLGASQPVPPDDDPYGAFSRIFGDLSDDPESLARLRSHRHHVLDAVQQDYKALNAKLGSADREKLSNHLDAIESIEKRLDSPGLLGGACALPTVGAPTDIYANDNYPAIGKLQLDLLAMALACDLTRVGSIQWASTQAGKMFTWLGLNDTHHNLSHSSNSNADAQAKLTSIGKWHAEQLAYFMGKLASIPEGDGTLLDNTLILWCTDISAGNSHSRRDMPYLLAGGAGGYLEMGRYLQYAGTPHTHLLISIANAMGVNIQSFGNPEYGTGPLPRLAAQSYGVPFVHWQP